jgi:signal peptidase I
MKKLLELIKKEKKFITIVIIIIILKIFVFNFILVKGDSMNPKYKNNDFMFLNKIIYSFKPIRRGEVIVLKYRNNDLIKRVIGLPNDKIKVENGKLYINNKEVKENYINSYTASYDFDEITLKDNEYFVMGDNRYNSYDSRNFGTIMKNNIIGRVEFRIFPFDKR